MVVLGVGGASYERGTPALIQNTISGISELAVVYLEGVKIKQPPVWTSLGDKLEALLFGNTTPCVKSHRSSYIGVCLFVCPSVCPSASGHPAPTHLALAQ